MRGKEISNYINQFLSEKDIRNIKIGRYQSWNIVFEDFIKSNDRDYLARSLTIYLASWGMMRGSSKLLTNYNYSVHIQAVEEIILKTHKEMKMYPSDECELDKYISIVWETLVALKKYYSSKGVSPTDTLLSKIILGTSAAIPAYDTYFRKFLKKNKITQKLSKDSLKEVWMLWFAVQSEIPKLDYPYPPMKKIDMAGFQYGITAES